MTLQNIFVMGLGTIRKVFHQELLMFSIGHLTCKKHSQHSEHDSKAYSREKSPTNFWYLRILFMQYKCYNCSQKVSFIFFQ